MGDTNRRNSQLGRISCPNRECRLHGRRNEGNIARHGFYKAGSARRRRYRCRVCGTTFGVRTGTAYAGLQCSMRAFDQVMAMTVEGISKSSIGRVVGRSWNTVARWQERGALFARRFNTAKTPGFVLRELQLDEIRTFYPSRKRSRWIFTSIEVWSRLWPATVVGPRTYRNTKRLVREVRHLSHSFHYPLMTTDGFKFYAPAIQRVFGLACVLGQVVKKIRKDRVVRVDTRVMFGSEWKLEDALVESEDSEKLNTAFIERLNLTIRQGLAYMGRRSACHARSKERLEDHLELLRCHYNFCRPHSSLRFGGEVRTPAQQAELVSRKLCWRDIFAGDTARSLFVVVGPGIPGQDRARGTNRCAA